jgi:hypothetical protein
VIFYGGGHTGQMFDPRTGRWSVMAAGPIGCVGTVLGTWTGSEFLAVCDNDAATFDPGTDTWSNVFADVPTFDYNQDGPIGTGPSFADILRTGDRIVVMGNTDLGAPGDRIDGIICTP